MAHLRRFFPTAAVARLPYYFRGLYAKQASRGPLKQFFGLFFGLTLFVVQTSAAQLNAETLLLETYHEHCQRITTQSADADFTALRHSFAQLESAQQRLTQSQQLQEKMFLALEQDEFAQCAMLAEQALALDYTSIQGHYGAMVCSFQRNENDAGLHHQWVVRGLVESLRASGRGDLSQEPYHAINKAEVDGFLRLMGFEIRQRVETQREGLGLEVITVYNPQSDEQQQLFFRFAQLLGTEDHVEPQAQ